MKKNRAYQFILPALLFCSFSAVSSISIEDELDIICEYISNKSGDNSIYTDRDQIYSELRQKLLDNAGDNQSYLFALPHLDVGTFNQSIRILNKWFSSEPDDDDKKHGNATILHTWSFISGIRVFGMKEHGSYYFYNYHLKDRESLNTDYNQALFKHNREQPLRYTSTKIYRGGDAANPLSVPSSLATSSVFFRSKFGRYDLKGAEERQVTVTDFFTKGHFCEIKSDLPSVTQFLEGVLTLSQKTLSEDAKDFALEGEQPYYSLGILKLLQNTAIYFSRATDSSETDASKVKHSYVVTGPCSLATTGYLGLQDGIFLSHDPVDGVDRICRLMAYQVYYRAFHKKFPSEQWQSVNYSFCLDLPFDEFKALSDEHNKISDKPNINKELYFSMRFAEFIRGHPVGKKKDDYQSHLLQNSYKLLKNLWEQLEALQLHRALTKKKKRWFEPSEVVDIEKIIQTLEDNNDSLDYKGTVMEYPRPDHYTYEDMVEHLCDPDYQKVKELKVYGLLGDVSKLSSALKDNILPNLHTLDISRNRLLENEKEEFFSLLKRPNFQYLVAQHIRMSQKYKEDKRIIWLPELYISSYLRRGLISEEIAINQQRYYDTMGVN